MPHNSESLSARVKRRKFLFLLVVAMLILVLFVFLIHISNAREVPCKSQRNEKHELKLVHVFFRHGARTPADTYPNDKYVNETFAPYGWGQLTNEGKAQMYELGDFLRQRYHDFIDNSNLNLNDIHAQSTGVSRAKMSLQLVLASLFPPKNTPLEWNSDLNWQPIPYNYEELDKDSLLLVRKDCPRYHEELERVLNEDVADKIKYYERMMKELSKITGLDIKTPDDVQSLYSTLKAEKEFGLQLPKWTEEYFPNQMQNLTDKSYIFNAYNKVLKKLKGGVFVKKAISEWKLKRDDKLNKKFYVYGGHDSTVTNILSALNAWNDGIFPDYASCGILEFSQHKETNEFGVEIFLRISKSFIPLTIPGCDHFCELNKLESLLQDNIPQNWQEECKALNENFTTPPIGGP